MERRSPAGYLWMALAAVWFGLLYLFSGTSVYIDGDDASSIAYHVMGRDPALQSPYFAYHGMMDRLLSLLPAREPLLRTFSFSLFKAAELLLVILILALVFDWAEVRSWKRRALLTLAILLAAPELSYLGLGYAPSLIAMCLVVSAHLLLRGDSQTRRAPKNADGPLPRTPTLSRWERELNPSPTGRGARTASPLGSGVREEMRQARSWVFPLLLFGLGVSFRWNVLTYGLVIFADLASSPRFDANLRARLGPALIWGILALPASLLMIALSGYGPTAILAAFPRAAYVFNQAGTLAPGAASSLMDALQNTALTLTTLLTPGFVLLAALGLLRIIRLRSPLIWPLIAGLIGVLPWIGSGVPKFLIVCLPVLLLAFALGAGALLSSQGNLRPVLVGAAVLLLIPWLVGVRVSRERTSWGPAFERKPYDYKEVTGTHLSLTAGAGLAFPTPEGPRPLWGHAYVLFGGGWKRFILADAAERTRDIAYAVDHNLPILITSWSPDFFLDELYALGFHTTDPKDHASADGAFIERRFTDDRGRAVTTYFHEIESDSESGLLQLKRDSHLPRFVVINAYPGNMRIIYITYPSTLQALGPRSAVLDFPFYGLPPGN